MQWLRQLFKRRRENALPETEVRLAKATDRAEKVADVSSKQAAAATDWLTAREGRHAPRQEARAKARLVQIDAQIDVLRASK